MVKILFSVCGIGLGHATRCHAIINEFLKHKNVELKVVSYGTGYKYLKEQGVDCQEISGYEYKGEFTFSALLSILDSIRDPTKLRRDYYEFLKVTEDFKPDIVLSDTEPNAFFYAYRRSIPNYILTNLISILNNYLLVPQRYITRDILMQQFMIDRLINFMKKRANRFYVPTFEQKVRYMENVVYTDIIVRKKPSEMPSQEELKQKLGIERDFYYVSVGGAEIEKYLFYIFEKILPTFKDKYFIISSNNLTDKVIEKDNMKIIPFIPNALEYISLAKGIIAPAGHSTISEAVCFRKPILAIPVRNHIEQLTNAALLQKEGFGRPCYLDQKGVFETIKGCIEQFFAEEEQINVSLGSARANGFGAMQIVRDILSR